MIKLAPPNLIGHAMQYVAQAINCNYVGPGGPFVEKFEYMVAEASGRKWAIAVDSCTAALMASAYQLRPREVVLYDDAYPAMARAMITLGLEFACFSSGSIDHDFALYGEGWPTIADRAPAIGTVQFSTTTVDCYSFAPNKTVTCGKGGAICGDDPRLEELMRKFVSAKKTPGFNFWMSNLNAAIGCSQMEMLEQFLTTKRAIWNRYRDAGINMVERGPSRWMSTMSMPSSPAVLITKLRNAAIEYRIEGDFGISLPCGTGLTTAEQDKVIEVLTS